MVMTEDLELVAEFEADEGLRRRLGQLLARFDTRKSAAEVAQKSVDQLQAYLKGRSAVPLLPIARLCAAKGVSLDWLASGQDNGTLVAGFGEAEAGSYLAEPPVVLVPAYRPKGSAQEDATAELALSPLFVREVLGSAPDRLVTVQVSGNAMAPTVGDRDLLVVDSSDRRLSDGCLYALDTGGEPLVRRVARQATGGVRLLADNAAYAEELVSADCLDRLAVIGRVVWLGCAR